MSVKPVRLQLSRSKGFNLQKLSRETNGLEAMNVSRPSKWGNPWVVGKTVDDRITGTGVVHDVVFIITPEFAVSQYRLWMRPATDSVRLQLHGKNLACWCKPGEPCHADVLLEIANR